MATKSVPRSPSLEACTRHYTAHRERFVVGERVRARHILFAVTPGVEVATLRARAEGCLLDVRCHDGCAQSRFAAAARELSNCPSGEQGGELGWLAPDDCAPEFARENSGCQARGLPMFYPGRVSDRLGGDPKFSQALYFLSYEPMTIPPSKGRTVDAKTAGANINEAAAAPNDAGSTKVEAVNAPRVVEKRPTKLPDAPVSRPSNGQHPRIESTGVENETPSATFPVNVGRLVTLGPIRYRHRYALALFGLVAITIVPSWFRPNEDVAPPTVPQQAGVSSALDAVRNALFDVGQPRFK
jgi:hypothetical protein